MAKMSCFLVFYQTMLSQLSAEEWEEQGMHKYGLIAVNMAGNAAQVEKVIQYSCIPSCINHCTIHITKKAK